MQYHGTVTAVTLILALGASLAVRAADPVAPGAVTVTQAAADMTDGEIRKIDRDNGKITIKHGEIRNLDMPAMTMVFVVKDVAQLGALQAGDKVRFRVIKDNGAYLVTEIQAAK